MSIRYGQSESINCGLGHLSIECGQKIEYIEIYIFRDIYLEDCLAEALESLSQSIEIVNKITEGKR